MSWSWWGLPGVCVLAAAVAASTALLRLPQKSVLNRLMVRVLLLEGLFVAGTLGVVFFAADRSTAFVAALVGAISGAALPFQYLAFLGQALSTPLTSPFRRAGVRKALGLMSVAAALVVALRPSLVIGEFYSPGWAAWNFEIASSGMVVIALQAIVSLFALVAGVAAWRRAPPESVARTQAGWFVAAFGLRDAYAFVLQGGFPVLRPIPFWGDFLYNPAQGSIYLLYMCLLAYAVLQHQLFDIDLKIKTALRRGMVGAVIGGGFFVGSEIIENVVPADGMVVGLIVAAAVAAIIRPLNRAASRLTDRVMRQVEDTPEYRQERKLRVYRGALEGALADGVIRDEEQTALEVLQRQLGLSDEDVRCLRPSPPLG